MNLEYDKIIYSFSIILLLLAIIHLLTSPDPWRQKGLESGTSSIHLLDVLETNLAAEPELAIALL